MTIPEFLSLLKANRARFHWKLESDTRRESERRSTPRFHIRGTPAEDPSSEALDPLRAVCSVLTGRIFNYGEWSDMADALDMEVSATAMLVAAANDRIWSGTGELRAPASHLVSLRHELLEAVGLPGVSDDAGT